MDLEKIDPQKVVERQSLSLKKHTLRSIQQANKPNNSGSIILADISGSMCGEKMDSLKSTLKQVAPRAQTIIAFESHIWEVPRDKIDELSAMGRTSCFGALKEGWSRTPKHMILITDGKTTDAKPHEILAHVVENELTRIPIDTIGISEMRDRYEYDPDFLRELARLTGGKFTDVNEPLQLSAVVQMLLDCRKPEKIEGGAINL